MNKVIRRNMIITIILFTFIWITLFFFRINNIYLKFSKLTEFELIMEVVIRRSLAYVAIVSLILLIFNKSNKYYEILNDKKNLLNRENRLFLNSPIVLFQWPATQNLPVIYVSNNIFKVLGYSKDDFLSGKLKYADIIYKDDIERVFKEAQDYSKDRKTKEFQQRYRVVKADKTVIDIHDKTYIIRDEKGELLYFDGYIIDITEQVNMEKEIFNKTNDLKNFESIRGLGYWELDIRSNKLYWSDGAYDIFELDPKEFDVSYGSFLDKIHPDDREAVSEKYNESLKNNTDYRVEHRIIVKNKIKHVLEYCRTFFDENKNAIQSLGVILDITKEKKLEKELLKVKNLESLGIVAGGLAHNLNNLIFIIQGNLDLIVTNNQDNIENINESVKRIKDLSQKMLIFAEGGEPIKKINNNFLTFVKEVAEKALLKEEIEIHFNFPETSYSLNIDENMIKESLINIIDNSIDAFNLNKIEKKIIHFSAILVDDFKSQNQIKYGKFIKLTIQDNAGGISKKHKENVILPYFTTKNNNLGLGLTMVDSVIKRHEGAFYIDTEEYFGTKAIIYLPIEDNKINEDLLMKVKSPALSIMEGLVSQTHNNRVLIMDDEELILKMSKKFLENHGYEVEIAFHGAQAIEKYKERYINNKSFKAVILDLSIPNGMGGQETAQELLKIDKNSKLIVSSGYSNSDIISNYKNYGFINRLPKPYKFSDLLELLRDI